MRHKSSLKLHLLNVVLFENVYECLCNDTDTIVSLWAQIMDKHKNELNELAKFTNSNKMIRIFWGIFQCFRFNANLIIRLLNLVHLIEDPR